MVNTFDTAMRMMRKHDPQVREDGFGLLEPVAADFINELLVAFDSEPEDGLKWWLLYLIEAARSSAALPLLTRELTSDDESMRSWAERGLKELDTKEARTILWRYRHPAPETGRDE